MSALGLRPDVPVGEDQTLPDHVLGFDSFWAAFRGEVDDDAVAYELARHLPLLAVLIRTRDDRLTAGERDFPRAARVPRVVPSAGRANRRDLAARPASQARRASRPDKGAAGSRGYLATDSAGLGVRALAVRVHHDIRESRERRSHQRRSSDPSDELAARRLRG